MRKDKKGDAIYTTARRKRIKKQAIEYKGGKCCICGYSGCSRALTFHHLDPKKKSFHITQGNTHTWDKVQEELDKCILVCFNCHMEIECGCKEIHD